ncbi:sulfatase-like hydrolase/transferase [Labrenzia sp. OB1]|uniref:sulfatase family protein n=1 Tax=Labrenzia sp. OB1 TaxID=1561204 RepID=UPI0007B2C770|nr:sulfatase-like hydrolase/transferase [Labrenzia sp. OB1]KZM49271.1 sulfatase [Labrenzia sp. OB1]
MARRPNFLVFVTDQQRADWLGCYGHPTLRTPNIDALAARGTRFEDFHVAMPVCMPNRASLLTGRYPSIHGLRYNGCVLSERANTFVEVLAASGYRTAAIGKSHLQPFTGQPPKGQLSAETGPIEEAWKPDPVTYEEEEPDTYSSDQPYAIRTPYYGYQHVEMVTGHGDRCGGHYGQWFRRRHENWRELHDPANELPHNYQCPQAYRTPVPEESYPTAWIRDRAADWLRVQAGEEDPFFSFVSFPDPHHPFNPPGRYWSMYEPDQFEVALPYEAHRNPPPPLRHLRDRWERNVPEEISQAAFYADEQALREAMALTAGMTTMIDDAIGDVLAALEASGRAEDTIVIFTSDHGDYLGDFNLLLKGALPLPAITRVPFIWADPKDPVRRTCSDLASTIDIAATVLEKAGVKPYRGMQGQSLIDSIGGGEGPRSALLIEHHDGGARMGFNEPARVRCLLTDRWRLTFYKDQDWGELYDRQADPQETLNLWDDPEHASVRSELTERLVHMMMSTMEESPRATRLA